MDIFLTWTCQLKHEKYTLADRNNPNVATGFSDYFEFSHFETNDKEGFLSLVATWWHTSWRELLNTEKDLETLYQNDCTDSSDSDCRQIHAVIKQVTENDVENRNFQYLATSGYFVHDFEELNIKKNLR